MGEAARTRDGRRGWHRRTGLRWRSAVAVGAVVLGVSGCSLVPGSTATGSLGGGGSAGSGGGQTLPAGQEGLAKFYGQQLQWEGCGTAQCAWLEVPVDYANPGGETVKLRVLKVPARGKPKGALFVNPGGPGGSATQYASYASQIVSSKVRDVYDVVGIDPRGVGQSNPITCYDDEKMDQVMGSDPTPDNAQEVQQAVTDAKAFGQACKEKYPSLLGHLSTVDVAKDMDIARGVFGQSKLTYLGKSYGTYLGAVYAGLFPQRVGRLVLDGAMTPDLTEAQLNLGQAQGFETATRAYVKDCVDQGGCPLGDSVDGGMAKIGDILKKLDSNPLPVQGDPRVRQLTEGWGFAGLAEAMYDEDLWPELTAALRGVNAGDGTDLFKLAIQYAHRDASGRYSDNLMQVISAVNCLDHPARKLTDEQQAKEKEEFAKSAPLWGPIMASPSYTCQNWPFPATAQPAPVRAEGADPILVVGTTRDPATPYAWAQSLAKQLAKAQLVTYDGDGHTAYRRSNSCVDAAVDAYFLDGKVPDSEVKC